MKILSAIFLGICAAAALAADPPAQPATRVITKDAVRKAIALFRAEPVSEHGLGAAALILRFAQDSPDVEVTMSHTALPWLGTPSRPKRGSTLLTAYIAGSVLSQLDSGVTKNDPVAGAEQVIETYLLLKKTDPDLQIAGVEELVDLKAQGKLKAHVEAGK